jgi:O-antigen ligase
MLWALTASASRGASATTLVSLVVFAAFRDGLRFDRRVLTRVVVLAAVLVGVGTLVYQTDLFPSTLKERIASTVDQQAGHQVSDDRIALDRAGMRAFLQSPLVGTGFDNFRYVAQFYDDQATFHDPHNVWVQFLAQSGLLGAAAFLFIIGRWFVLMVRSQRYARTRSDRELLWAFVAAMTGLMVHSMLAPLVLQRHYWLLYGLGIAAAVVVSRERASTAAPTNGS